MPHSVAQLQISEQKAVEQILMLSRIQGNHHAPVFLGVTAIRFWTKSFHIVCFKDKDLTQTCATTLNSLSFTDPKSYRTNVKRK